MNSLLLFTFYYKYLICRNSIKHDLGNKTVLYLLCNRINGLFQCKTERRNSQGEHGLTLRACGRKLSFNVFLSNFLLKKEKKIRLPVDNAKWCKSFNPNGALDISCFKNSLNPDQLGPEAS